MTRRLSRSLIIVLTLPLAACSFYGDDWPALKQDPIPAEREAAAPPAGNDDALELPGAPGQTAPITTATEAARRLADYRDRFSTLEKAASSQLAGLNTGPRTPSEWGQAQIDLSRLTRIETDLRTLRDAVRADERALSAALPDKAAEEAMAFRTLADSLDSLVMRMVEGRTKAQLTLDSIEPVDERPQAPAPALPKGNPALTITADAAPAAYSEAVSTLVEKAQAISKTNLYHVVAAADPAAAERARNIRSLLAAGGVADTRIDILTDPAADAGSVRIFVE